ncbi:hypothetical protein ABIE71_002234 [Bradyrhizobium diazoefficiens]
MVSRSPDLAAKLLGINTLSEKRGYPFEGRAPANIPRL